LREELATDGRSRWVSWNDGGSIGEELRNVRRQVELLNDRVPLTGTRVYTFTVSLSTGKGLTVLARDSEEAIRKARTLVDVEDTLGEVVLVKRSPAAVVV
jgi:hypothetical protein